MVNINTNRKQLTSELEALRRRVVELEEVDAEQKRRKEALKGAEQQLRVIVENTYDIIFQLSSLGVIQYVSPRVKEIYGYEPEYLIGKHLKKTTPVNELPRALETLKSACSGKAIRQFEINQLDANGKIFTMEINGTPVRKDGEIIAVTGIMRDITERKRADVETKHSTEKLMNAMENTISAMAMIVEMRDPFTAGHQRRVTQLACAIGKEIGLSGDQITGLRLAGLIHDIGKVRVPAEILTNPDGLSEAEFAMIKMHPVLGYEILKTMDLPWPIAHIIHQHHERMDGSGYPLGLSSKDIILEARVLAVADVVEAISSHRPYRSPLGIDKALDEILQKRGILYDAKVVDACLKLFREQGFEFEQGAAGVAMFNT
jgi:PAS domain S-box-containing protein/putative nucleotidyltransferase with HDIG domain